MHDIRLIRDDPEAFDAAMKRRGLGPQAEQVLDYDGSARTFQTDIQRKQAEKNDLAKTAGEISREIRNLDFKLQATNNLEGISDRESTASELAAEIRYKTETFTRNSQSSKSLNSFIDELRLRLQSVQRSTEILLASLPNRPADDVPDGKDEGYSPGWTPRTKTTYGTFVVHASSGG